VVNDKYSTQLFDAVIVCAGHYTNPFIPEYKGTELFEGRQTHSHFYRTADEFAGTYGCF
jgi:cation diffusion facilitator CzcD-associated flavoprotein CzcO